MSLILGIESSCDETAAAVVRFQGNNGLEQTGIATVATQALLYGQGRD